MDGAMTSSVCHSGRGAERRDPGPRIAGMTSLYEFYFDYFRQATYCFEIERMHKTYGRQILRPL